MSASVKSLPANGDTPNNGKYRSVTFIDFDALWRAGVEHPVGKDGPFDRD
jgi:hypothetical protein